MELIGSILDFWGIGFDTTREIIRTLCIYPILILIFLSLFGGAMFDKAVDDVTFLNYEMHEAVKEIKDRNKQP